MENKKPKVLAIDDNPDNLISIKALIKESFPFAQIFTALNGIQGIEIAAAHDPDVILLDIVMPDMDGFEVCKKLKADEALKDIPVVFVTALKSDKQSRIYALECGAEAFLAKPMDESELTAQIRAMVKIKAANVDKRDEKERLKDLVEEQIAHLKEAQKATLNMMDDLKKENEKRRKTEIELRQTEERYSKAFKTSPYAILITGIKDGKFLEVNDAFIGMSGYSYEEIIGNSSIALKFWANIEDRNQVVASLMKGEEVKGKEFQFKRKNGDVLTGLFAAHIIQLNNERYILSSINDVSERIQITNALVESERLLRESQTIANLGSFVWNLSNGIWNSSTILDTIFGIDETYFRTLEGWINIVHPEWRDIMLNYVTEEVLGKHQKFDKEYQIIRPSDGGVRWLHGVAQLEFDQNHLPTKLIGTISDITERKEIAERLLTEKRLLDTIIENIPDQIYYKDKNSRFVVCNAAVASNSGVAFSDDMVGKTDFDFFKPALAKQYFEEEQALMKSGVPLVNHEETVINADFNGVRYNLTTKVPLKDSAGNVIGLIGINKDITERKQIEEKIHESEQKYRLITEKMTDVVWLMDLRGNSVYVSPSILYFTGFTVEEYLEQRIETRFTPESAAIGLPIFAEEIKHYLESPEVRENYSKNLEMEYKCKDGSTKWGELRVTPYYDGDGKFVGIQGVTRDITTRHRALDELHHSEEKYRTIFDNVQDVFYQIDMKGNILEISPSIKHFSEFDREDLLGTPVAKLYDNPDDRETFLSTIMKSGEVNDFEVRMKNKNGTTKNGSVNARLIYDKHGKPNHIDGAIRDITERKRAQEAVHKIGKHYQALIEKAPDGIVLLDSASKFVYVSPSARKIFGYELTDIVQGDPVELTHPDDLPVLLPELNRILVDPTCNPVVAYRFRSKQGLWIWIESTFTNLLDDPNVEAIVINFREITERKLAEAKLREEQEKLSTLFESMTEMVALHELVFNENGEPIDYKIVDVNDAFIRILGIKREDAVGKLATEVYQTDNPPFLEAYARVASTREPYDFTMHYPSIDKHLMVSVVSPKLNTFATITTDITEIRRIQEAMEAKNKELENYLYITTHDLRTPLVNIQGHGNKLEQYTKTITDALAACNEECPMDESVNQIASTKVPRALGFILANVTKMDRLLEGLLRISRTGRLSLNIDKVDMNKLIASVVYTQQYQIKKLSATVNIQNLPDCYGDLNLLNQVFSNLVGNAIKYRHTKRQLVINVGAQDTFNRIVYAIADNGMGIEERHLQKIWNVFYRVDSGSPEAGEGIGLAFVKRIVEKHHGKIWVESEAGVGSTFFLELPKNNFEE